MARQYRHIDAALLRASTYAGEADSVPWPDLSVGINVGNNLGMDGDALCGWLAQVWSQPSLAQAVAIASPTLAARVEAMGEDPRPSPGQARRMVMSAARYLVRLRGRATPFGTFAGVAALRFGHQTSVRWTDDHQTRTRADAAWLAAVVTLLEACPTLWPHLSVTSNTLAVVRGDRVVVPGGPRADDSHAGATVEVSVRHSRAVQVVLRATRSPIRVADLIDQIAAAFPTAPRSAVEAMLRELIAYGVLITSLRPPSMIADGLGHVVDQLPAVDAIGAPEVALLVGELRAIRTQLLAADAALGWADGRARHAVAARMRAVPGAVEQPLMVDLRLGCTTALPAQVAIEAEAAAGALLRLTPHPHGHPAWRDFHTRFLDRYGPHAVVAVTDLVDPTAGLGFPRHYAQPPDPAATAWLPRRDERLLALAQQAAVDGAQEVVLDEDMIDSLAAGDGASVRPVPHIDLCVDVRAHTTSALTQGAFTLAVTGIAATAIATSGRFLDLLPDADRARMIGLYRQLPVGVEGAIPAQLSFPAHNSHAQNVLHAPRVLPHLISVAEHHDTHDRIPVGDLAVTADHHRMYLVSLSRRRVVEPVLTHAAARHAMPALARVLFEIPRATNAAVSVFDWGAADCLPFRPRVRYGRSILAAARWRISPGRLPGPAASRSDWTASLGALRDRLGLPAAVYVGTGDRRLRLNLDDPLDLAVLREHVHKLGGAFTVAEAPTAADHGWFDGRPHEITIPLAATAPPAQPPAVLATSAPLPIVGAEHGALPGSPVLNAQVYGHPDIVDTILTQHLPTLLATWDEPPMWWFARYRTPTPQLRLRLQGLLEYGQAANRVGVWAADLRRRGLVGDLTLSTYRPETARYGSGATMGAAEALFAADSTAVLIQLLAQANTRAVSARALIAASLVDLACAMTGSRSRGMRWLLEHADLTGHAPIGDRTVVREAVELADVNAATPALLTLPNGGQIAHAWAQRRHAATQYAGCLSADNSHITPSSVLVSLLHMHHVRARGIDPDEEALSHRVARAVALAWKARSAAAEEEL